MVIFSALVALALVVSTEGSVGPSTNSSFCSESKECLEYELVCKTEEYEVRHYSPTRWVSTDAEAYFMGVGAAMAFRRLFQYITGANNAGVQMEMTAPVLVKIPEETKLWEPAIYTLSFPLPSAYQDQPPSPTNDKLYFTEMPAMDVYVRSYGGWMLSITSRLHTHLLTKELGRVQASYNHTFHYGVGYDSPLKLVNRHNEVWYVAEGQPVCTDPQEPTPAHTTTAAPTTTSDDSSTTDAPSDSPPRALMMMSDSPASSSSPEDDDTPASSNNLSSVAPPSNLSSSSVEMPSNASTPVPPSPNNASSSVVMPANLSLMPPSSNLSSFAPSDDLPTSSLGDGEEDDLSSSEATTSSNVSADATTVASSSSDAPPSSSSSPSFHDTPAAPSTPQSSLPEVSETSSSSFSDLPMFAKLVSEEGDDHHPPTTTASNDTASATSEEDEVSSSSSSASPSLEPHTTAADDVDLCNNTTTTTVHADAPGSPETQDDSP